MCNSLSEPCPGRCNSKSTQPAYRSAFQRAAGSVKRALGRCHESPPAMDLSVRDIETTLPSNSELRELLRAANWEPGGAESADAWGAIEASERREQARASLKDFYGSEMWVALAAGYAVAERSEEIAGITSEEAREDWYDRLEQAEAAYKGFPAIMSERVMNGEDPVVVAADLAMLREKYNAVCNGTDPVTQKALRRLADGYRAALAEIRPMGGKLTVDQDSNPVAVEALQSGAKYFPTEWTRISNGGRPLYVKVKQNGGGYYLNRGEGHTEVLHRAVDSFTAPPGRVPVATADGEWVPVHAQPNGVVVYQRERWEVADPGAQIPKSIAWQYEEWTHPETGERRWRRPAMEGRKVYKDVSGISVGYVGPVTIEGAGVLEATAIHEQAHRYESTVASIVEMETEFLKARTTLSDGTREALVPYGDDETGGLVRPDHFATAYTGREPYAHDGATEILSTGVEALFGGQYGGQIGVQGYRADLEMRAFVLGVLATASGRKDLDA